MNCYWRNTRKIWLGVARDEGTVDMQVVVPVGGEKSEKERDLLIDR